MGSRLDRLAIDHRMVHRLHQQMRTLGQRGMTMRWDFGRTTRPVS